MAVVKTPTNHHTAHGVPNRGYDNGDPVYRRRSMTNVKHNATDQNIYNVAETLAGLQIYNLGRSNPNRQRPAQRRRHVRTT